jgi:hypothetical protein
MRNRFPCHPTMEKNFSPKAQKGTIVTWTQNQTITKQIPLIRIEKSPLSWLGKQEQFFSWSERENNNKKVKCRHHITKRESSWTLGCDDRVKT